MLPELSESSVNPNGERLVRSFYVCGIRPSILQKAMMKVWEGTLLHICLFFLPNDIDLSNN
jgi:hypothetical protein